MMNATSTDRIEKQIELNAPVARVWRAISDYKEFGEWFKVKLESPFVTGETTRGQITCPGYEHLAMDIVVEKMEEERLFSYRWRPTDIDPNVDTSSEPSTLVEFTLEAKGDRTVLRITESGFDGISQQRRDEAYRRNEGGWTGQIANIESYVNTNR